MIALQLYYDEDRGKWVVYDRFLETVIKQSDTKSGLRDVAVGQAQKYADDRRERMAVEVYSKENVHLRSLGVDPSP